MYPGAGVLAGGGQLTPNQQEQGYGSSTEGHTSP